MTEAMRNIWLTVVAYMRFLFTTWENILLLDCGSAPYSIRPDEMYTYCEARSAAAGSNIILLPETGQSSERGEAIDEMMYTIYRHIDPGEVKVYDVGIAQGQTPTSDVVKRDLVGYTEFDGGCGHLPE